MITDTEKGREFLARHNAVATDEFIDDTHRVRTYEVTIGHGVQEWVEVESKLEPPEYYYSLHRKKATP